MKDLLIIPALLASTRLPEKVLAEIDGKPMIALVLQQAKRANIGEVVVAACGSVDNQADLERVRSIANSK